MIGPNDDAVEAFKDANGGLSRTVRAPYRRPGYCVHCGAKTANPTGLICRRCFDAAEARDELARRYVADACPTCGAAPYSACDGELPGSVHASRIRQALTLAGVR